MAIIGGGMAGLVCALNLEARGVKSTVFDTVRLLGTPPLYCFSILNWGFGYRESFGLYVCFAVISLQIRAFYFGLIKLQFSIRFVSWAAVETPRDWFQSSIRVWVSRKFWSLAVSAVVISLQIRAFLVS